MSQVRTRARRLGQGLDRHPERGRLLDVVADHQHFVDAVVHRGEGLQVGDVHPDAGAVEGHLASAGHAHHGEQVVGHTPVGVLAHEHELVARLDGELFGEVDPHHGLHRGVVGEPCAVVHGAVEAGDGGFFAGRDAHELCARRGVGAASEREAVHPGRNRDHLGQGTDGLGEGGGQGVVGALLRGVVGVVDLYMTDGLRDHQVEHP